VEVDSNVDEDSIRAAIAAIWKGKIQILTIQIAKESFINSTKTSSQNSHVSTQLPSQFFSSV